MAMMSSFWGVEVKAGKAVAVEPSPDEAYHLTQVALGKGHKPGSATAVQLEVASQDLAARKFVIGTLVSGSVNQFTAEMLFQEPFQLSHTGTGSVFVMGFKQEDLYNDLVKAYDEWDGSGSSDEEGGPYSSDEEEDPSLDELDEEELKRKIGKKLVAKRQQPGGGAKPEMDSSDDEDYDDMEEDTSDSEDGPDAVLDFEDDDLDEDGSSLEDDEDSSSSDDDDEPGAGAGSEDSEYSEDEEKLVKGDKKKVSKIPVVKQGAKKKGQAAPADESSDSYSSEDDSSGSGDDGSDSSSDSSSEEEEAPPKAKGKRAAPATPAGPGKKSKTGGTPPSRQEGPKTPQTDAEYEKHLISYLRKHGAQDMSALGLAIKRPPRVAKLSMFLKERGDVFVRDGNKVSLK